MTTEQLAAAEAHLARQARRITLASLLQAPGLEKFTPRSILRAPGFPDASDRTPSGFEIFDRRALRAWLRRVHGRLNTETATFD